MKYSRRNTLLALVFAIFLLPNTAIEAQPSLIGRLYADSSQESFSYFAAVGDQDGDGRSDILMSAIGSNHLYMIPGPTTGIATSFFQWQGWTLIESDVGDVNGDGAIDFVLAHTSPDGCQLWLYYGGTELDSLPDARLGESSTEPVVFIDVRQGHDLDNDGMNEIIGSNSVYAGMGSYYDGVFIFELEDPPDSVADVEIGRYVPGVSDYYFGGQIEVADWNGDGYHDLAISRRSVSDSVVGAALLYWGGPQWDTLPDLIIAHPEPFNSRRASFAHGIMAAPGDLNGDGYADLVLGSGQVINDTATYVYYGGPTMDDIPDVVLDNPISRAERAGDINDDGFDDLLTAYTVGTKESHILIYYGGPLFSSVPDVTLDSLDFYPDARYLGRQIRGIGDYDGDGIDDFAVSVNNLSQTYLQIYAGFEEIVTDVGDSDDGELPITPALFQNYPNPFNPSTTMRFSLPYASPVTITVLDLQGRLVRHLVSKRFSAGTHEVDWDGCNESGDRVATGVYLYRLCHENGSESRKMLLLK